MIFRTKKKNQKNYFQRQFFASKAQIIDNLKRYISTKIDELFFKFTQADKESHAQLFEEINKELEALLSKENNDTDSTDGIFDFLSQISDSVEEAFDELLSGDSDKKRFVKALSKVFALLVNTRVNTAGSLKLT